MKNIFRLRFSLGLDLYEEGYSLALPFVRGIPLRFLPAREPRDIMESWGISYSDKSLFLRWGVKYKLIWMPWDWGSSVRWDVETRRGGLAPIYHEHDPESDLEYLDGRMVWRAPYTYYLKNGEVQYRIATYHVSEMEWRWRCFQKLYKRGIKIGPKLVRRSICVEFNQQVGERTGSWKGGVLGCGYDIREGETPHETLRRMEKERKF